MYFSGDGAVKDEDGFIQITGRMDDVINISGHRLGTAEIEDVMVRIKHQISIFGARNLLLDIKGFTNQTIVISGVVKGLFRILTLRFLRPL